MFLKDVTLTFFFLFMGLEFSASIYAQNGNYAAPASASAGTGTLNTVVGDNAGWTLSTGSANSFFGRRAGQANTGGRSNCFLGDQAGFQNSTGSENTFVGRSSGFWNEMGESNIAIGNTAGPSSLNRNQDYRLYIDVEPSDDPLIYGEFDNDFVRINGTFEVTAGLANPSDVNLKTNFKKVNESKILDEITNIKIQQWTYKDRPDETHIGATAQDFYEAFGLGADDKHISTIDADGVALAAIQALKKQNDSLREEVNELKSIVSSLIEKLEE